ncbi:MAG: GFA family protein [Alphaproteobacteria bacterium]|jgi:hypothetical protein
MFIHDMNDHKNTISGQCLCGAVRYEIRGSLSDPHACHCSQCRRQSGHYSVTTHLKRKDFSLTEVRGLKWYRSSSFAERGFCAECGSSLFWDDGGDEVYISVGSLNKTDGLKLAKHIFVDEKADYYEIDDALPMFASYDRAIVSD